MSGVDPTAASLLSQLESAVKSGDVESGKSVLTKLKIALVSAPSHNKETIRTKTLALELGVLLAVAEEDLDAFGRNLSQLKPLYNQEGGITDTPRKSHVLGLNLMFLLVENRLSEFHAELELLSPEEASQPWVSFPISLERQLMVGSYDEVLQAGLHVPDPSFTFFVDNLLQTVRDSIADCLEVSYKTLSKEEAMQMMKYDSMQDLETYIQEFRDDWIVEGNVILFQPPSGGKTASDIPSMKLIGQTLSYATEMERIV